MPKYPHYPENPPLSLDGVWDFSFLGAVDPEMVDVSTLSFTDKMAVPLAFDATPRYAARRGLVAYRTHKRLTPNRTGRLLVGGFGMWLQAWIDGQKLGTFALPYSPVQVIVPPAEREEREIVLLVDNRFDQERSPLVRQYFDFYAYGGIFRSVRWQEVDDWWIERVEVTPLDLQGRVALSLRLGGSVATLAEEIPIEFAFDSGSPSQVTVVRGEGREITWEAEVPHPQVWSPNSPRLHTVDITVRADQSMSRVIERFGIRTVKTRQGKILLNGLPVRLRGYNRHEAHPETGPALSVARHLEDLQILQDLGANCVRGSHYTQDQEFLELCDEAGFLVWEESLGWQQDQEQLTDPSFVALQVEQTERMVRESFNHPSVIVWGFLNEGESHLEATRPAYERLFQVVRALDSSRLVSYASNHIFEDKNLALTDVVSVNCYPGWYAESEQARPLEEVALELARISKHLAIAAPLKPIIISEIGAGALYGFRDRHRAHWSEEYQADYLERVCQEVLPHDQFEGLLLWQLFDMRTYENSRALFRPRSFNNKGTLDEYRRPKLAYEVVKRHFWTDAAQKPGGCSDGGK